MCLVFFSLVLDDHSFSLFLSLSVSLKIYNLSLFIYITALKLLFFFSFNDYICCSSRQIIKTLISFYSSVTVLLNLQTIKHDCTPYADQLVT